MPPTAVLTRTHMYAADVAARQRVIERLIKVCEVGKQENNFDIYAVCIPREPSSETTLTVIGESATQEALDGHAQLQIVKDLVKWFTTDASIFSAGPDISMTDVDSVIVRSEIMQISKPYIVTSAMKYKSGSRDAALEAWRKVAHDVRDNEPETLAFFIGEDQDNKTTVRTVEIYPNEEAFRKVEAKREVVKEDLEERSQDLLGMVAGHLYRSWPGDAPLREEYA